MVDFKEFIKRERLKRGWSQTLLGEKSSYSLNTIWKPRVKDSGSYIRLKEFYTSGRYKE